ncbi:carboxylate-amine ligase [Fulvivirga lutimaris]|uniref:carboxylate-amine ligase n=1 Tax=Fulvivirga lutimaris TaxID=1819566 RepID=UPI0012BC0F74|nr:glutamate-cysteine ligase family protein [Fulvivirga lutimaris]MTI39584.1 glutamate--cysteine ligase [Fulvivirga lutimaris]
MSSSRLHLFQAYGIELEYMIVDKSSMSTRPITDDVFKKIKGEYVSDIENKEVTWSNELVLHVVEIKCTKPEPDLEMMANAFAENVKALNQHLAGFDAKLLPSAAHPLMDPAKDTHLWPHDNNEVYELYNKMFNCKGHGWSNLQSTHINLPFYDDAEFAKLHAAIRLILPLIPAIAASSPILGGKNTGFLDKRMDYYQKNQRVIPSLTGKVIPERAFSKRQYHKLIYDNITHDIAKYNTDDILDPIWMNSRGAIARFDRGSIEIRIMDIQECPKADMAIVALIVNTLKMLVNEKFIGFHDQQLWEAEPLNEILQETMRNAESAIIDNKEFLQVFGIDKESAEAKEVWRHIFNKVVDAYPDEMAPWKETINTIINKGTLASRIIKALDNVYSEDNIKLVYQELADCLANNEMFVVWEKAKL